MTTLIVILVCVVGWGLVRPPARRPGVLRTASRLWFLSEITKMRRSS